MHCFQWSFRLWIVALVALCSSYYAGAQLPNCSQGCKQVTVWGFGGVLIKAYKYDQENAIYPDSPEHKVAKFASKDFYATKLIEKYDVEATDVKYKKGNCPDVKLTCSNKDTNADPVLQECTEVNCNQTMDTEKTLEKCKIKTT